MDQDWALMPNYNSKKKIYNITINKAQKFSFTAKTVRSSSIIAKLIQCKINKIICLLS